jgi:hypothetical protein
MEGFVKYAVEMGPDAKICVPGFINIGSGIQNWMGNTHTCRQHGDLVSLSLFLQNKESMLITWRTGRCRIINKLLLWMHIKIFYASYLYE